ncbi:MAG: ATP-grasp domain-containing protein [Polyangiaceae bacterium]
MKTVGILGGGQLGAMLASAIGDLGGDVAVYEPVKEAPACRRVQKFVNAPYSDRDALARFFDACDVVTYETEHIDTSALRALDTREKLRPSLRVLEVTQHREREKKFLAEQNLPHAMFDAVSDPSEIARSAEKIGFPCIAKTTRGGYDGKGQFYLAKPEDAAEPARILPKGTPCVVEEAIELVMEASCIVARAPNRASSGAAAAYDEVTFPIFENMHSAHILDLTLVPARVSAAVANAMRDLALKAAAALDVTGLLTTEFFLAKPTERSKVVVDGTAIYVNELAPRPHNSGHVTRTTCSSSQFDVLARILLGAPLTPVLEAAAGVHCMANLLGDLWAEDRRSPLDLSSWREFPDVVEVVLYGKRDAQARRKMGHVVTRGTDANVVMQRARAFRESLRRRRAPRPDGS